MSGKIIPFFLFFILSIFFFLSPVLAQSEAEKEFLTLYFTKEELVVISATRSLKSISRVAENVTVITVEDIELMNAHTLADVLYTVTGVQVGFDGGPGTIAWALIQGSDFTHVTVLIDGISINNLSDNVADISSIPSQIIQKIEVIKGPASSAWGSSLGGVVNVITKSFSKEDRTGGTFYASYGKRGSGDLGAEVYGGKNGFGFYLYAGKLRSDGLRPSFDVSIKNFYSTLKYDFSDDTNVALSFLYKKGKRGDGDDRDYDIYYGNEFKDLLLNLSFSTSLNKEVDMNVSVWELPRLDSYYMNQLSTGVELFRDTRRDKLYGASARLTWQHGRHDMVFGTDYSQGKLKADSISSGEPELRRFALYANDTIILDRLSITPGIRFDHTNISGDFVSPSIGVTYGVSRNLLLRGYIARGFNMPPLGYTSADSEIFGYKSNPDLNDEKIWSYQLGAETSGLKYLWLKFSLFRHDLSDVIKDEDITDPVFSWTKVNAGGQRRQGVEVEFRTVPVYHSTIFGGAIFVDPRDLDSDEELKRCSKYTYNIGLKYDDEKSFKALLTGRYLWWNAESDDDGKYGSFVFDLNAVRNIYKNGTTSLEAFLTARNILNGSQYWADIYKNPGRWVEGGIRLKF